MGLKKILEYNDWSYLEDEYGDDMGFQATKPKKRAKVHRAKNFKDTKTKKSKKRISKYSYNDLIKKIETSESDWFIKWNHTKEHDLLDRIVNRSKFDVPYINDKIRTIVDYIERKWTHFESGDYIFSLRDSNFKIVINLEKFRRKIYVSTILSYDMNNFQDIVNDVIMNESNINEVDILKDITLFI
jgi:hypothetical protein